MKKETWKTIIQVVVSILTAALTALGTTSCMGHDLNRNMLISPRPQSPNEVADFSFPPNPPLRHNATLPH